MYHENKTASNKITYDLFVITKDQKTTMKYNEIIINQDVY